jgi:hypothetical protein
MYAKDAQDAVLRYARDASLLRIVATAHTVSYERRCTGLMRLPDALITCYGVHATCVATVFG